MTELAKILKASENALRPFRAVQAQVGPALALQERLRPVLEAQRMVAPALAIQETLRPIIAMQEQWKGLVIQTPPWIEEMRRTARIFTGLMEPVVEQMQSINRVLGPSFQAIARTSAQCQRIEDAGWLPHYTTPFDHLDEADDEDFDEILEAHYRENWTEVRATFMTRVDAYDLDDEAKTAFADALTAHEAGLFRVTSRMLFPEIERVARQELHGQMSGETSQRALRQAAEELGLSDVEPGGMYAFRLFEKLFDHLYAPAKTLEALEAIARDPVPNRHAAMHGFLSYGSAKNSINMLLMADFLFQVICALKAQRQSEIPDAASAA